MQVKVKSQNPGDPAVTKKDPVIQTQTMKAKVRIKSTPKPEK